MFLSNTMLTISSPPPQAVLDKRPLWFVLIGILGITLILRVINLDILAGLLCALMICLSCIIIRDGMRDLPKFGLMFGLLCGINFVFYFMPIASSLILGKTEQHIVPAMTSGGGSGASGGYGSDRHLTYTLMVRTTPFFDFHKGFLYNAGSVGELLLPVAMLLGTYLGISAHYEYQSHIADFYDDALDDEAGANAEEAAQLLMQATAIDEATGRRGADYGAILGAATGGASLAPSANAEVPKNSHKAFQGPSYKLSA